jgi:FKBP12-rapamycin complex-associated protein
LVVQSLIVMRLLGELLRNTGEFMNSRFKEVCDTILKHKDHKEKIIKRTVLSLLPRLAAFASEEVPPHVSRTRTIAHAPPHTHTHTSLARCSVDADGPFFVSPLLLAKQFVLNYLNVCMQTLLGVLKKDGKNEERACAFIALGEIAQSVGTNIKPYLEQLVGILKNALNVKNKGYCLQSLTCVSMISSVVGVHLQKEMPEILGTLLCCSLATAHDSLAHLSHTYRTLLTDLMLSGGLNPTLTEALTELAIHIPSMLPTIQEKLMDQLSIVLSGKPFVHPGNRTTKLRKSLNMQTSVSTGSQTVKLRTHAYHRTRMLAHTHYGLALCHTKLSIDLRRQACGDPARAEDAGIVQPAGEASHRVCA